MSYVLSHSVRLLASVLDLAVKPHPLGRWSVRLSVRLIRRRLFDVSLCTDSEDLCWWLHAQQNPLPGILGNSHGEHKLYVLARQCRSIEDYPTRRNCSQDALTSARKWSGVFEGTERPGSRARNSWVKARDVAFLASSSSGTTRTGTGAPPGKLRAAITRFDGVGKLSAQAGWAGLWNERGGALLKERHSGNDRISVIQRTKISVIQRTKWQNFGHPAHQMAEFRSSSAPSESSEPGYFSSTSFCPPRCCLWLWWLWLSREEMAKFPSNPG
ncbi:hypothetical protein BC629DRAFT_1443558 [Irpex lacteus]|nr:hypothetical protein BC629DRAFT_1443558 [Irpex lacteus]